jgi:hypothetical protein
MRVQSSCIGLAADLRLDFRRRSCAGGWVAEWFKAAVLKYVASRDPGYLVSIHLAEIRRFLVNRARRFILINRVFLQFGWQIRWQTRWRNAPPDRRRGPADRGQRGETTVNPLFGKLPSCPYRATFVFLRPQGSDPI